MIIYECLSCFTRFIESEGKWDNGHLVCPSCGSEDLDDEVVDIPWDPVGAVEGL